MNLKIGLSRERDTINFMCCVGSGPCDRLITPVEQLYRVFVSNCVGLTISTKRRPSPELDCCVTGGKKTMGNEENAWM